MNRPHQPIPAAGPGQHRRAALAAAEDGYFVFPLLPAAKTPAIRGWPDAATRDRRLIERWWLAGPRNIGIAAGPSRLLVLDLDVGHRDPPPVRWAGARDGHDVLTLLAAEAGYHVPITRTVATPSGGRHLYFRAPLDPVLRNTAGHLGWCIDTRAAGGYVVAPGSTLPSGRYELLHPGPVAEIPTWLLALLAPRRPDPVEAADAGSRILHDRRAYVAAIVAGECRAVADARVGTRHHALLRAARNLGRLVGGGALTVSAARTALSAAARAYIDVAGYTAHQIDTDITDGLAYGAQLPRFLSAQP
jgi:hypothetical protein